MNLVSLEPITCALCMSDSKLLLMHTQWQHLNEKGVSRGKCISTFLRAGNLKICQKKKGCLLPFFPFSVGEGEGVFFSEATSLQCMQQVSWYQPNKVSLSRSLCVIFPFHQSPLPSFSVCNKYHGTSQTRSHYHVPCV